MKEFKPFALTIWLLAAMLWFGSCKKTEEVLIPDNTPPTDETIDNITVESYVNRTYIMLLGRKPDDTEMQAGVVTLRANNLSQANRESFVNSLLDDPRYFYNTYDIWRNYLLSNTDTTQVREQLDLFVYLQTDSTYIAFWDALAFEEGRLRDVVSIPDELIAGTLDFTEMQKRLTDNYFYDQLNMGTQNFVISHFQKLFFRYPTEAELAQAEAMVNGLPSFLFLESGKNRDDFLRIFYASDGYKEGQVVWLYNKLLYRQPDSREMTDQTKLYKDTGDIHNVLRFILTSDEFIGL
jgi:hypothetical protein